MEDSEHGLYVRKARKADIPELREISELTWEGHDYLAFVAEEWISDGGFYVGLADGRVVAAAKMTEMPGDVLWLEGLRVHPEHMGKGLGKRMAGHVMDLGKQALAEGRAAMLEFATYFSNQRSISISVRAGFEHIESYWILSSPDADAEPVSTGPEEARPDMEQFSIYGDRIPVGWKMVENSPEGVEWIQGRMRCLKMGGAMFLAEQEWNCCIPLLAGLEHPREMLRGIMALEKPNRDETTDIVFHQSMTGLYDILIEEGFYAWDDSPEANIFLFRLKP